MRNLKLVEIEILTKLLDIAELQIDIAELLVSPLDDGGMGSLAIGANYENRQFGKKIVEYMFKDFDGMFVSAALNVDKQGDLYEMDINPARKYHSSRVKEILISRRGLQLMVIPLIKATTQRWGFL